MTSPRQTPSYGNRGRLAGADAGIRRVAPTFGKELHLTSSSKAEEQFAVESDAERLVALALDVDPRVQRFQPQPFTVDLIDGRLLHSDEAVSEARKRHRHRIGRKFYTPDFAVYRADWPRGALEVKLEGFEGDAEYEGALATASGILEASGWRFLRLIVPADPRHPIRANLPLLKKAASRKELWPNADEVGQVHRACGGGRETLSRLCGELGISPNMMPVFVVCGALSADVFRNYINGALVLEACHGELTHLQLLEEFAK